MKHSLFIILLACALPVSAGNVLRTAKENLKKRQKLEQTMQELLAESAKPGMKHKQQVECLSLAAECSRGLNESENMKLYLKQAYDTVKFFNSIRDMFIYLERADSIGAQPNEKGCVNFSGRRRYRETLRPYRGNLLAGGMWHYQHGQTASAYNFFDTYIDAAYHPIFAQDSLWVKDVQLPLTAYLALFSAQKEGNIDGVIKYASLAKGAGQRSDQVQEYFARAWETKGDTLQWLTALKEGVRDYAANTYFFTHLMNYYTSQTQWDNGLALADSLSAAADTVPLFWYAKSMMLLRLGRDREAIDACDSCLALAPDHLEALYNKGVASLNLATIYAEKACTDLTNPQCQRDQEVVRSLYLLAKQPMERVRQLAPQDIERWAPALYRIYLHLNMGKEFDEMDRLLKNVQS